MRILSIVVACFAVVAGILSVLIISKFSVMFDELSYNIPTVAAVILDSSGWIPGGIFFLAAVLLIIFAALKKDKIAGIGAILTLLVMICTAVTVPFLLYSSLSESIHQLEVSNESKEQNKAEIATPRKPSD